MTDEFKVLRSTRVSSVGTLTAIISAGSLGQKSYFGEYFILIDEPNEAYLCKRVLVDATKVPEDMVLIDNEWMFDELKQQISGELSKFLWEIYERTEDKSCLIDPFELLEVDKKKLINLWIRGNQTKNIEHVYQNTQTSSLREYLQDIRVLPTFTSET